MMHPGKPDAKSIGRNPSPTRAEIRARGITLVLGTLLFIGVTASAAQAQDSDSCLFCHQFPGLSRLDSRGNLRLFYVDPQYVHDQAGPHARLACVDCHPSVEVGVVPHLPVTPVDCTRQCHLTLPNAPERRFSHANIARMLEQSVHSPQALRGLQFSEGDPLAPGQSQCLYCHDEPVFRQTERFALADHHMATSRCDVCHAEQVPLDTEYMLKHIGSRLRQARPSLELAQTCAICHSDPGILAQRQGEDAVASYVRSFHGKAVLLGDEEAASCIDCHAGVGQNAHLMLGPADPASSVHPQQVADSCVRCHLDADPSIAATAVHLDLPRSWGSVEFLIALAFLLITIFTFVPSALLVILELLHQVIGRHDGVHHALREVVARVLAHPQGPKRLRRFTAWQRVQHWVLTFFFVLLVLTGFPMKFADQRWAAEVINLFGGLAPARLVHHWAGLALLVGVLLHLLTAVLKVLRESRLPGSDGRPAGLLRAFGNLPMVMSLQDLRRTGQLMAHLIGLRRERPLFGRFSASEKFEYFGVLWGTVLLGVTGLMLWGEQTVSHLLGGRAFNIAAILHTYEAFLAVIHVGILHMCSVLLSPLVFPLSRATITGTTPAAKLAGENGEFVLHAARDLGISTDAVHAAAGGAHE